MSHWRSWAQQLQREAQDALPADATFREKSDAIRDAWPKQLGLLSNWPYKMWLIVRRQMLGLPILATGKARKKQLQEKKALAESGLVQSRLF